MSVATRSNRKWRQGFGAFESSGALGIPIFGKVKITLVVQVLPTRQLSTVWWHLYTIVCNPRSRQWCQMTSPSVVLYGWWAVPGRTREGEAIPLEGWQESLRGAKMSPKIGWVTARFPLGHVTGFVHLYVPLTEKKWPRLSPFLSAPESRVRLRGKKKHNPTCHRFGEEKKWMQGNLAFGEIV